LLEVGVGGLVEKSSPLLNPKIQLLLIIISIF